MSLIIAVMSLAGLIIAAIMFGSLVGAILIKFRQVTEGP